MDETIIMLIVACHLVLVLGLQIQVRNLNQKIKEPIQNHHNHLICSICGNIVNLEIDVDKSLMPTEKLQGFEIDEIYTTSMAYVPNVKIRKVSLIENEYTA